MPNFHCNDADFADVWRASKTIAEVLEALKQLGAPYKEGTVRRRASALGLSPKPSSSQYKFQGANDLFAKAWSSSATVEEVAAKMREAGFHYRLSGLRAKASRLRSYGYRLKRMPRNRATDNAPETVTRISNEQFAALWNAAPNLTSARAAIEQASNRTYAWNRVSERAYTLRKAGMRLKHFSRADATHCKRGHAFTDDCVVNNGKGRFKRLCRVCDRERRRKVDFQKRLPKRVLELSAKLQKLLEAQASVGRSEQGAICTGDGDSQSPST